MRKQYNNNNNENSNKWRFLNKDSVNEIEKISLAKVISLKQFLNLLGEWEKWKYSVE